MIAIIAAIGERNELGKNNGLIWDIPKDLKFFRETTRDSVVVLGKNTFNSLPKILPGRRHLILSEDSNFNKEINENVEVFNTLEGIIDRCRELEKENKVFIIGGATIYRLFMNIANRLYITHIHATDKDADVFFPEIDEKIWDKKLLADVEDNNIEFSHVEYNRI